MIELPGKVTSADVAAELNRRSEEVVQSKPEDIDIVWRVDEKYKIVHDRESSVGFRIVYNPKFGPESLTERERTFIASL